VSRGRRRSRRAQQAGEDGEGGARRQGRGPTGRMRWWKRGSNCTI
jgi:hypothetical protein